jgi:oligopeptidase B
VLRDDHFNWLRDMTRTKTDVLDHLKAENAYFEETLSPLVPLQDVLYKEMLSHLKETGIASSSNIIFPTQQHYLG